MTEVLFPPLSADHPRATGVLSRWYAREGERVTRDQLLAEVMVDKVAADVVSPADGTLHRLVEEDAEVVQGTAIATLA